MSTPLRISPCPQGIIGRVNAYYSFNAAIDAAADALEAEQEKEREEAAKAAASDAAAVDHDSSSEKIVLRLPPIEQTNRVSERPRSASRPINTGRPNRSDGWHLG